MVKRLLVVLVVVTAEVFVSEPQRLKEQVYDEYGEFRIPSTRSNFGRPLYDSFLVGHLFYPSVDHQGCTSFSPPDSLHPWFFLFDSGGCSLDTKLKHGQDSGASAVLTPNSDTDSRLSTYILSTNVTIPSFLISDFDAELLKSVLSLHQLVTLNLTFEVSKPVLSLLISNGDTASRALIQELAPVIEAIEDEVDFIPVYVEEDCVYSSAKHLLIEDLRQLCIHHIHPKLWWTYVLHLIQVCPISDLASTCYAKAYTASGVDADRIESCVSENINGDKDLWKYNKQAGNRFETKEIPLFLVDDIAIEGSIESHMVLSALCASFPAISSKCASGRQLQQAVRKELKDGDPERTTELGESMHTFLYQFTIRERVPGNYLRLEAAFYTNPEAITLTFEGGNRPTTTCTQICVFQLPPADVLINVPYKVDVSCSGPCHFSLVMSYKNPVNLHFGEFLRGVLQKDSSRSYDITTSGTAPSELVITLIPESLKLPTMAVWEVQSMENFEVGDSWHIGQTCHISPTKPNTTYRVMLSATYNAQFTVTATSRTGVQVVQPGNPTQGSVSIGQFAYYKLLVDNPNETLIIQLTTFEGIAAIYVKYGIRPTESSSSDFTLAKHAKNGTLAIDKHQRSALGYPTGDYYIGIYGESESVFTLLVTINANSWVPLFDGLPQNGYADFEEPDYYYLDLESNQDVNVTFRVNVLHGNPDLYVRLCTSPEQRICEFTQDQLTTPQLYSDIYYSRKDTGDESISISHAADKCTTEKCRYVAAVLGKTTSRTQFSIIGTLDKASEYVLMSGQPMEMTLYQADYVYFKYSVFNTSVTNVTIQLTPVYGDPDLYVTREGLPSMENYEKASTNPQTLVDKVDYVKGLDGLTLRFTFHIAVYSTTPTAFSIVAIERVPGRNTTLQLYPGKSQQDTVYSRLNENYRVYLFAVHYLDNSGEELSLTLSPISGRYELFVANNPLAVDFNEGVFYYDWCYCGVQATDKPVTLIISPNHPSFKSESDYLVLVKAISFGQDFTASYVITYSTESSITTLQESIPFQDQVFHSAYKTYSFPILAVHEDVRIEVMPVTGDPDVYLSFSEANQRPTKEEHDYYIRSHGPEVASIQWEEGLGTACVRNEKGELQNCRIYIGVYGYTTSVYTITVSVRTHQPILLPLSMPASGTLPKAEWRYYFSLIQTSLPLSIHLQSHTGDSNLYLNILDYVVVGSDSTALLRPTQDQHEYSSVSVWMLDAIDLAPSLLSETCASGACIAVIGVTCVSLNCTYSLSATQEATYMLLEEEPKIGFVAAFQYTYYVFYNLHNMTSIAISVTPLDSGDPALFVSRGDTSKPTRATHEWISLHPGREYLVLSPTDSAFKRTGTMTGYYAIGVWAGTNCTFSISVSTHVLPIVTILPRIPVEGVLSAGNVSYYKYENLDVGDLEFRVTPIEGSAELLISPYQPDNGDIYAYLPTMNSSTWSSLISGIRNTIKIPQALRQTYLIGVFPQTDRCHYSLGVYLSLAKTLLLNGIPVQNYVQGTEWQYYEFMVDPNSGVDVSLTVYSGSVDMYVTTSDYVSDSSYLWKSRSEGSNKHIRINRNEITTRFVLIGIYGNTAASFAVTVHSRDSAISLIDGWPHVYSLLMDPRDHLYFRYPVMTDAISSIECRLKSLAVDFWPLVNVKFTNESDFHLSSDSIGQYYNESDYEHMFQTLTMKLPFQGLGSFIITVYGSAVEGRSMDETRSFELTCSGQTDFMVLRPDMVSEGKVTLKSTKKRYELFVAEFSLLKVVVVTCQGRINVLISSNYTQETESNSDISITRTADNKVLGTILHAKGQYYVTVEYLRGDIGGEATYQLSAQVLLPGFPPPSSLTAGNDGQLTWSVHRKEVDLTWSPAVYDNGDTATDFIAYVLYASESKTVKLSSTCGIAAAVKSGLAWELTPTPLIETNYTLEISEDTWTQVNVIAIEPFVRSPLLNMASYSPTEILIKRRNGGFSIAWVAVLVVALLLTLAGLGLYHLKYRKAKKRLEHEVTVVRGVTSEAKDIEMPNQTYSSVVTS